IGKHAEFATWSGRGHLPRLSLKDDSGRCDYLEWKILCQVDRSRPDQPSRASRSAQLPSGQARMGEKVRALAALEQSISELDRTGYVSAKAQFIGESPIHSTLPMTIADEKSETGGPLRR